MIIIDIFFFIVIFSFLVMLGLGIMVWLRLRLLVLRSFFKGTVNPEPPSSNYENDKIIDGEYTVIPPSKNHDQL